DRRNVLALEARPGDLPDADTELGADDLRERRLAEAGRAREQHVIECLAARLRRLERDLELLLHALLADEVRERARAERSLELLLGLGEHGCEELRHAAARSASRTCSSTGSDPSTAASARSASSRDQPRLTSASRASVSSTGSDASASTALSFS